MPDASIGSGNENVSRKKSVLDHQHVTGPDVGHVARVPVPDDIVRIPFLDPLHD